jgi:hypothetical protein
LRGRGVDHMMQDLVGTTADLRAVFADGPNDKARPARSPKLTSPYPPFCHPLRR